MKIQIFHSVFLLLFLPVAYHQEQILEKCNIPAFPKVPNNGFDISIAPLSLSKNFKLPPFPLLFIIFISRIFIELTMLKSTKTEHKNIY